MCNFSLVDGDNHDQETDAQTGDRSTGVQPVDVLCGGLKAGAHDKDEGSDEDGPTSSKVITPWAGERSTEEGASGE